MASSGSYSLRLFLRKKLCHLPLGFSFVRLAFVCGSEPDDAMLASMMRSVLDFALSWSCVAIGIGESIRSLDL